MKEIKFRAWDKKNKRWFEHYNYSVVIDTLGRVYLSCEEGLFDPIDCGFDLEIVLDTGLKDKNNKEIYEGDIVKMYYGMQHLIGEYIYEVVFEKYQWILKNKDHLQGAWTNHT